MALQKDKEDRAGNTGNYWRVDQMTQIRNGMILESRLNLYKSNADRQAGKRAMGINLIVTLGIPAGNPTLSEMIATTYSHLKANDPYFADATDV